jgi:hypothetical protein
LLDKATVERFATATNVWQGRMLGLAPVDLAEFESYYRFYRTP